MGKLQKYKTHYFNKYKNNAVVCGVNLSDDNWYRQKLFSDKLKNVPCYCTSDIAKVTCKNCLKILKAKKGFSINEENK